MIFTNFAAGFLIFSSMIAGQGTVSSQSTVPMILEDRSSALDGRYIDHTRRDAVEEYVREYFEETPILAEVAFCESTYRHFGLDGEVLKGNVNDDDVGVMQINEYYHLDTAQDLGYNLHSIEGNLAYAQYLYEREGVQPWSSSRKCWSHSEAYNQLAIK